MEEAMTKQRLKEYRSLKLELIQLQNEKECLYSMAGNCVRHAGKPPGYGGKHDPLPDIMDKLSDVDKVLLPLIERATREMGQIEKAIEGLPPTERVLMRAYYIEGLSWDGVAKRMSYSKRNVLRVHGRILEKMALNVT